MEFSEEKEIEIDLQNFVNKNLVLPYSCSDIEQVNLYVKELCGKIEEYEFRFNYVPSKAYFLLAQYNHVQNMMIYKSFVELYS